MTPEQTNWDEIRALIAATQRTLGGEATLPPEEQQHLLRERARALAKEPETANEKRARLEVVAFELAGEHYAIELRQVREVCLLHEITPVPCTPPFILGIVNLRGKIRTVIDLKRFFDLPHAGLTELNKVIFIEGADMQLGILADAILGVRRIAVDELDAPPPTLSGRRGDYSRGVTRDRLVVLNAERILSDPRILVDDGVT